MPGSGAVQLRRGENLLDTRLFQRQTCREVVREPLLPGGRHWRFSYLVLGRLRTTLPESILPGQCRSRCYQYFRRVLILSRKPDGGRLPGQFLDLDLRPQIHRPLDPGCQIPLRPQVKYPKPNCHHALWMTRRHQSRSLVCSCSEDRPGLVGK